MNWREIDAYIDAHWLEQTDTEIARALGLKTYQVRDRRHALGYIKSPKMRAGIMLKQKLDHEREQRLLHQEIQHLKRRLAEEQQAAGQLDRIENAIRSSLPRYTFSDPRPPRTKRRRVAEVACYVISDTHFGQRFSKAELGGLNEYSLEVAAQRLEVVTEKAARIAQEKIGAEKLYVFILGDLVSGSIHDELEATNEISVPEQALFAADRIQQALRYLHQYVPELEVVALSGNHGRVRKAKWAARRQYESWDYVTCRIVEAVLSQLKNIRFHIPRSPFVIVDVAGLKVLASHGDHIRSSTSWAGIPFYGLSRDTFRRRVLLSEHDQHFDVALLGHFHTSAVVPLAGDLKVILAPSLVGPDPYSETLAAGSRPAALFFGVAPSVGITSIWELHPDQ